MTFYVIGIDDNPHPEFSSEVQHIITTHAIFSGGSRHYSIVSSCLPAHHQWIPVTIPLSQVFNQYANHAEIVVFASGDPLFFGFANTLQREMPQADLIVYPHFNSLQLLAHRLLMPYQDMHIVSLTGRPWNKLDEALIMGYDKIGILTDSKAHTPATIAQRLLDYGYDNYKMSIGEQLGNRAHENVSTLELNEVSSHMFAFPNNIILQKTYHRPRPFGIPEQDFELLDGRSKMITKWPIRLLSLSMLDLRTKQTLWDVGFCTGSVSIEAKLQFPHLQIIAFEKREAGAQLMTINSKRFGTPGIEMVIGDFLLTDTSAYPQPDAVFIGGHGGMLEPMIEKIASVIQPNGILVFNSVSPDSRELFVIAIEKHGFIITGQTSTTIDNHNTIEVIKAIYTR